MTASTRCRSVAPPGVDCIHQFGDDDTRKTVCIASSDMPWVRRILIAWTDCAHELTMFCTWVLTESLSDIVTPRTFNVVTRMIPGSSDGGVNCRCRLVVKTISTDLLRFSVRLLAAAHASTLFNSLCLVSNDAVRSAVPGWRVAEVCPFEVFPKCVNRPWGRSVVGRQYAYFLHWSHILLFRYVMDVAREE